MTQPTIQQRLDARCRPANKQHVMYQKWRDLLFLHWEFPIDVIQKSLPPSLTVDTFNNKAYLGVVPFFMQDVRPRYCPSVPGISNFLEMNLRTYVYDKNGRPGVWFYSLDANQWLAVRIARSLFNLPYFDAQMSADKESGIIYKSSRKDASSSSHSHSHYYYEELNEVPAPEPESFEFFLIERYYLFAVNRAGKLFSGKVFHTPYPLKNVNAKVISNNVITHAGFEQPNRPPEHAIMSRGVDVSIFPIEKV